MLGDSYSLLERGVHRMVFGSAVLQDLLEDVERLLFGEAWKSVPIIKPVFVTSLPRAGTTILLEALSRIPGTATHRYRDMPFIFSPHLWEHFPSGERLNQAKVERAHGDGIRIGIDSPEAFEEVFWKKFFPRCYSADGIALWREAGTEFESYFREQIKKLIALRGGASAKPGRYLSKNNANIARIEILKRLFPDAFVVVPLRNPVEHAISMWRQHHNFLAQHARNAFTRQYMEDIGHYEFGELHRPIRFPLLDELTLGLEPTMPDYWLAYWIAAFDYLSAHSGFDIVRYETLSCSGVEGMTALLSHLELAADADVVADAASVLHPPPPPRRDDHPVDEQLAERAMSLYEELVNRCLLS